MCWNHSISNLNFWNINWMIIDLNGRSWFYESGTIIIVTNGMASMREKAEAQISSHDWCGITSAFCVMDLDLILAPTLTTCMIVRNLLFKKRKKSLLFLISHFLLLLKIKILLNINHLPGPLLVLYVCACSCWVCWVFNILCNT